MYNPPDRKRRPGERENIKVKYKIAQFKSNFKTLVRFQTTHTFYSNYLCGMLAVNLL